VCNIKFDVINLRIFITFSEPVKLARKQIGRQADRFRAMLHNELRKVAGFGQGRVLKVLKDKGGRIKDKGRGREWGRARVRASEKKPCS
jgi:hypothetical protein